MNDVRLSLVQFCGVILPQLYCCHNPFLEAMFEQKKLSLYKKKPYYLRIWNRLFLMGLKIDVEDDTDTQAMRVSLLKSK